MQVPISDLVRPRRALISYAATVGGPCDPEQVVGQQCGLSASNLPAYCNNQFMCGGIGSQCASPPAFSHL
jgi:hypothetical protein